MASVNLRIRIRPALIPAAQIMTQLYSRRFGMAPFNVPLSQRWLIAGAIVCSIIFFCTYRFHNWGQRPGYQGQSTQLTLASAIVPLTSSAKFVASANHSAVPLHVPNWAYVGQFRENLSATVEEINRNLTYGEDAGAVGNPAGNVASICGNSNARPCRSVLYLNANNATINNGKCGTRYGESVDFPYGHGNWLSHARESWYIHVAGTSSSPATRLYGVQRRPCGHRYSVTNYVINQADPGFIQWINDALQNSVFNDGLVKPDLYSALMVDNTLPKQVRFYSYVGEERSCGNPLKSLSNSEVKIVSNDCSMSAEYPSDEAYQKMHLVFLNSLRHSPNGPYHGQPFDTFYNGLVTPDMTLLVGGPHVLGGICEGCVVSGGRPASAKSIANLLDIASHVNNKTTKSLVVLSSGSHDIGSQEQLRDRRLHRAALWLSFKEKQTISWANLEAGQPTQSPEWPEDFIYPRNPLQSMLAGSAGQHGAADLIVDGPYPAAVYRREFTDCTVGTSGRAVPIGRCAVLLNLSSSPVAVQQDWLSAKYAHHLGFCSGFASYTDDPGCNPATSAGDVLGAHGTGPGALDMSSLPVRSGDTVPPRDAIFLVTK